MPKVATDKPELVQTTLSFSRPSPTSSSSRSNPSSSNDRKDASSSHSSRSLGRTRSLGRSGEGSFRGRGRGSSGNEAAASVKRDAFRLLASENETLHIPALLQSSLELALAIKSSVSYPCLPPTTPISTLEAGRRTLFRFWNMDSFDCAEILCKKWGGDKVAVLNMANAHVPGGGYINGATAQEEALCRRSTLYAHIAYPEFYPFHSEGGLWSEGVRVFRRGDDENGRVMDAEEQFEVGVISAAAVNRPRLRNQGTAYADPSEQETTIHKIMAILRIAKLHNQRSLVLGAFGCGAFQNPPLLMASFFRHLLTRDPEFTNCFEEVVFAILERSGSNNMAPWREVWKGLAESDSGPILPIMSVRGPSVSLSDTHIDVGVLVEKGTGEIPQITQV